MPPGIYNRDDEGFLKPFQYLHPGIRKPSVPEQIYQPHVFQQSVTLTASMWDETNDSKRNMDWSFDDWGILGKYSPLFIGLVCGFGIVLLIMSTVMLWRYCVISASNKLCCKGTYGEMRTQQQKSLPVRKDSNGDKAGFEDFQTKPPFQMPPFPNTLRRSATIDSVSMHNVSKCEVEDKLLHQGVSVNNIYVDLQPQSRLTDTSHYAEPVLSSDHYTSHSYLRELGTISPDSKNLSRSTPGLEDLYAKVNFSKKRKNRMRRDDAAVIAISKSHSGQNNCFDSFGSAVVVYNERTAL